MKVQCRALLSPYFRQARSVASHHTPNKISNPYHRFCLLGWRKPPNDFLVSCCAFDASKSSPRGSRGFSGSLCGALINTTRPQNHQKYFDKITGFNFLLHVAAFCFHACSKSSPRGWRGFSGSLCGALVNLTRPKNHQNNLKEINMFSFFAPCVFLFLPCLFQEQCSGQSLLVGLSF